MEAIVSINSHLNEERVKMTREKLFDIIAPIHIYHKADLMYKKEAIKSFRKLKKYRQEKNVKDLFGENIEVLWIRSIDKVDFHVFWRIYNQLFQEIVLSSIPYLKASYDTSGSKCFKYDGGMVLAGDEDDCFPFYLSTTRRPLPQCRIGEG